LATPRAGSCSRILSTSPSSHAVAGCGWPCARNWTAQSSGARGGGQPVMLTTKVSVKADADYVMIEIPIPAGCTYKEKEQGYYHNEVHREYFKNKVSIFCRSLSKGEHVFTISLLPRYTGRYQLNPARAEMMYFPLFYGREGIKEVDIY